MRCIVFNNRKGGVGKTTSAVNVAAGLMEEGKRVLLVDLDSQAHATLSLGAKPEPDRCVVDFIVSGEHTAIIKVRDKNKGLYLLSSSSRLSRFEQELIKKPSMLMEFKRRLKEFADGFDYVIVDTSPNFGALTLSAYLACKEIIVPMPPQFLSLKALAETKMLVEKVRKRNPQLVISGVLPTFYNPHLRHTSAVIREVKKVVDGNRVLPPVRNSVRFAEAPSFGKTIFEYAPNSRVAEDYLLVTRAIMKMEKQ